MVGSRAACTHVRVLQHQVARQHLYHDRDHPIGQGAVGTGQRGEPPCQQRPQPQTTQRNEDGTAH